MEFVDINGILSVNQHGIISKKSTTTNLLCCVCDWADNKNVVEIIYFDLAKTFDSVVHSKLLCKLTKLGLGRSLMEWIKN